MARFVFHVIENSTLDEGVAIELAGLEEARRQVQTFVGEWLKESKTSIFATDLIVRVANDAGLTLFEILVIGNDAPAAPAAMVAIPPRQPA